jgi:hypothetical protein
VNCPGDVLEFFRNETLAHDPHHEVAMAVEVLGVLPDSTRVRMLAAMGGEPVVVQVTQEALKL